jgi:hypothetical protein
VIMGDPGREAFPRPMPSVCRTNVTRGRPGDCHARSIRSALAGGSIPLEQPLDDVTLDGGSYRQLTARLGSSEPALTTWTII